MNQINSNLNNSPEYINSLYDAAVECSESYEQLLDQCKLENNFADNWQRLESYQNTFTSIINDLILVEESDPYFTNLLHVRAQFFHHMTFIYCLKDQIRYDDITITRLPSTSNLHHHKKEKKKSHHVEKKHNSSKSPELDCNVPSATVDVLDVTSKRRKIEENNKDDSKLENNIEQTLMQPNSKGLCEIVGLNDVKSLLKEIVIFPMMYPHLFKGVCKPWSKALLYGPPGTGKTKLVHSIAAEVGAKLYSVSNADLLSRWVGESEKLLRALFQTCIKKEEHSIIFFDEVDSFCRTRNSAEADHSRRLKNELLTQLSELDNLKDNKIYFLAATNCPWDIDPAFIRRFHKRIYVPLPNRDTRLEMLQYYANSHIEDSEKLEEILNKTDGFSGSDMSDLANSAAYQPIKELEKANLWLITQDCKYIPTSVESPMTLKLSLASIPPQKVAVREVNVDDYLEALKYVSKTVTDGDRLKYDDFIDKFIK